MIVKRFLIIFSCITNVIYIDGHSLFMFDGLDEYAFAVFQRRYLREKVFHFNSFKKMPILQHNMCEKIRTARIFELADKNTPIKRQSYTPKNRIIEKSAIRNEKLHLMGLNRRSSKEEFELGNESVLKTSFPCTEPNSGYYKWTVIYGKNIPSGFLFQQASHGIDTKKLIAVIDEHGRIMKDSQEDIEKAFSEIDDYHRNDSTLCVIGMNIQFRLCSLTAEVLHTLQNPDNEMARSETDHQFVYKDPYSNYYYPEENFTDSCPHLNLVVNNIHKKMRFLKCRVSIKEADYQFYIVRDRRTYSELFVAIQENQSFALKYHVHIPLLDYVVKLDSAGKKISARTPVGNINPRFNRLMHGMFE